MTGELCETAELFFSASAEVVFDVDVGETTGSGSSEAAHPFLSLHIRTIRMRAFKRVILSMQNRCHAVTASYTSAENANLPPQTRRDTVSFFIVTFN